jgi:flagellar motor switch protein FliM
MAQTLSQAEVDALLVGLEHGSIAPEPNARDGQMHPRQFQVLKHCHDSLCRNLSASWRQLTNSSVDVQLISIDECNNESFLKTLAGNCVAEVELARRNSQLLCGVSNSIVFSIVQSMLGSDISIDVRAPARLTGVELKLASRAIDVLLECYERAWSNDEPLQLKMQSLENEPTGLPITPLNEVVVVVRLAVSIANSSGTCVIAWPLELLNELIPSTELPARGAEIDTASELSVQLPEFDCTIDQLEVGQVIQTGFEPQESVRVLLDGVPRFVGSMGASNGHKAVRLEREILD